MNRFEAHVRPLKLLLKRKNVATHLIATDNFEEKIWQGEGTNESFVLYKG